LKSLKCKEADDLDCLCKTQDFDSLENVKKVDDLDCLCMTIDFDSSENVKKSVATCPSAGARHGTRWCVFQGRKMHGVATNVYSRKTSEKPKMKKG